MLRAFCASIGPPVATGQRQIIDALVRIETIWILLPLVFVFWSTVTMPIPPDGWWMIGMGRYLAETGTLPATYPFTFPEQSARFVDSQWLGQLVAYGAYHLLGLKGVVLLSAFLAVTTFGLLFWMAWRRSHSMRVAAVCTLGAGLLASTNLQPRAQMLAFLFFVLTYWLLQPAPGDELRSGRQEAGRLALLGIVGVLWANSHATFLLGPLLAFTLAAGSVVENVLSKGWPSAINRRAVLLTGAGVIQLAAIMVTPYQLALIEYLARVAHHPTVWSSIVEWQPTLPTSITGVLFFGSLVAVAILMTRMHREVRASDLLLMAVFALMGIRALRNVVWWGLVIAPIMASYLAALHPAFRPDRRRPLFLPPIARATNVLFLALLLLVGLWSLPWARELNPLPGADQRGVVSDAYPRKAARFLASQPRCGRVFTLHTWSSYLNWRLTPRCRTMLDQPVVIFPPNVWDDAQAISAGAESSTQLLDRYRADLLVLSRDEQQALISRIDRTPTWTRVYQDEVAEVFVRSPRRS
jgi:hypothetical protein